MRAPPDAEQPQDTASRYGPGIPVTVWITPRHKAFLARKGHGRRPVSDGARRVIEDHPDWKKEETE